MISIEYFIGGKEKSKIGDFRGLNFYKNIINLLTKVSKYVIIKRGEKNWA